MAHYCHWPKCRVRVRPEFWGCGFHWGLLPKWLRDKIWRAYRPGQEIDKRPSAEYVAVAKKAQDWINERYQNG